MATHHGSSGQPLHRDANTNGKETDDNYHHEDTGDFDPIGQNDTNLANLTQELDDLCHRVQDGEGQPAEVLHHIEQELQRLIIALHPSAPPEPLNDALRHYMDTTCSAQRQTNLTNTVLQNIIIFTGNDATQLEDWLLDVETAADLANSHFDQRSPYIRQELGRH